MKFSRKWIKRLVLVVLVLPVVLFAMLVLALYWKQDAVVQQMITTLNEDFNGLLLVEDSHISPFANFPYISIDLEKVRVFESKDSTLAPLLEVNDIYLGFDLLTILKGDMNVRSVKLHKGSLNLVQHTDGSFNIAHALSSNKEIEDAGKEFHLDIQSIHLSNIDLLKLNEANHVLIEAYVYEAHSRYKSSGDRVHVAMESRFEMNILHEGDTTYVRHKHFKIETGIDFNNRTHVLSIEPSELYMEAAHFKVDGTIDLDDDMNMDIRFHGHKPNFDLFVAFAPEELLPTLRLYENAGKIYFDATVRGKAINGYNPMVVADFGCGDAYVNNTVFDRKLDQLFFKAHFTTGAQCNASTMEFSLEDFRARPEAGTFTGALKVRNFESPEIDMKIHADFELDFLAQFLNINDLKDLSGSVKLDMNFHDIIDLAHPERSIEKFNESYFTKLTVRNLGFTAPGFHLPVRNLNVDAHIEGHEAFIDQFSMKAGASDIELSARVSDLPAILHHTDLPVTAQIEMNAALLNLYELTASETLHSKPVNEQLKNLSVKLHFNSTARNFTESPNLPQGEFFIDNLNVSLQNYPHRLHDFHADVFIDSADMRLIDFSGIIDKSDFHFNGKLWHYDLWFMDEPQGDTRVDFNLSSRLIQLKDLFTYNGENNIPEDYRHEELREFKLHGVADMHFKKSLHSADISLDHLQARMNVHPMRFEDFKGSVHFEDQHFVLKEFGGRLGHSRFALDLNYYLGSDSLVKKRDNRLVLRAASLDFDQLFNYNPPPAGKAATPAEHEAGFNIYTVPFTDMQFDAHISRLNYHRILIRDFYTTGRVTHNHFIYLDTLHMHTAGGEVSLSGYFNGSDPKRIYFNPVLKLRHVDMDQLMFKFENFGQDKLVAENLHGQLSGTISGKVHLHADMVPIVDDSELSMDIEVLNGRLENYSALHAMADFFKDKNLNKVRFDTLRNNLSLKYGQLTVPAMTINSTLGFIEISGGQDLSMNMDYYVRVPWKLVTQAAAQKLFGKDKEIDPEQEDEIQYRDENKRTRFLNIRISGTPEDYQITLDRNKLRGK